MSTATKVIEKLESFGLKKEGENKYRANSPLRRDSDSNAFTLTVGADGETGAYFDHVTQESGSLYALAAHLGIETPTRAAVENTKRTYAGLDDYALAHGITGDVLRAALWTEDVKDNRVALRFPTRTGQRWRFLDGQKPHYKSEPGYRRTWYGLNGDAFKLMQSGQPLVIANGEISVVAAHHHNIAAICQTGGEAAIETELLNQLVLDLGELHPDVLIALDCDSTGRRVAQEMTAQFRSLGFKAKPVDLALTTGGDLADFCMLHGDLAATALLDCEPLTAVGINHNRGWTLIHARDLKNLPPIRWLIEPEIPQKALVVIYGPSGAGKSFIGLDYALRIAQAETVVYVAAEGQSGYQQRVGAWCQHNQRSEGHLYVSLGTPNLFDPEQLQEFIGEIAPLSPVLLVVDTLAMAMIGGDENSTRDMAKIMSACIDLIREVECSVILVHHTGKAGVVERGSSVIRGSADMMIRVTNDDGLIIIESDKSKDAAPFPTKYKRLLPIILADGQESRVVVNSEKVVQTATDPLTQNQERILRTMALPVYHDGIVFADLCEITGLGRGSVARVLSRLLELGHIEQEKKRGPYAITASGMGFVHEDSVDSVDSVDSATAGPPSLQKQPSLPSLPSLQPQSLLETEETPLTGSHYEVEDDPR